MNQVIAWGQIKCIKHPQQVATFLHRGDWYCTSCRRELEKSDPPTSDDERPTEPRIALPMVTVRD